jgi:hypothetical protein
MVNNMLPKSRELFLALVKNLREFAGFLNAGESPCRIYNEEGRLHSEKEPAFRSATRITWYRNGRKHGLDADVFGSTCYYWNGVFIPKNYFLDPDNLKLENILCHPNAEVRVVGVEIYGYERMLKEGSLETLDRDETKDQTLFKFTSSYLHENIILVRVKNSTAEADGSFKYYFLCVPPDTASCCEAVAWTFNRTPNEYHPSIET